MHEADLLLHVTDVSHPAHEEQRETVLAFLRELDLAHIPRLEVYSKIDRLPPDDLLRTDPASDAAVAVSAATGERLGELLVRVEALLSFGGEREFLVPYQRLGVLTRLRGEGRVLGEVALPEGLRVRIRCDEAAAARLIRALAHPRFATRTDANWTD